MEKPKPTWTFVGQCGDGRCGCGCGELLAPILVIADQQEAPEGETEVERGEVPLPQGSTARS